MSSCKQASKQMPRVRCIVLPLDAHIPREKSIDRTDGQTDSPPAFTHPHHILRHAHSKIHRRSDALVNLKLALAFSDRALYARAIALFQPLFEV